MNKSDSNYLERNSAVFLKKTYLDCREKKTAFKQRKKEKVEVPGFPECFRGFLGAFQGGFRGSFRFLGVQDGV